MPDPAPGTDTQPRAEERLAGRMRATDFPHFVKGNSIPIKTRLISMEEGGRVGAGLGFSPIVGLYWANVSAKSFQVRFKGRQSEGTGLQNLEKTSRSLIKKRDEREDPCVCMRAAEPGTP